MGASTLLKLNSGHLACIQRFLIKIWLQMEIKNTQPSKCDHVQMKLCTKAYFVVVITLVAQ